MIAGIDNRTEPITIIKRNGNAAHYGLRVGKLGLAITGKVEADLMTEAGHCAGKSANHIRQTAGLRKGHAFRSHKSNMHEDSTSRTDAAALERRAIMITCSCEHGMILLSGNLAG